MAKRQVGRPPIPDARRRLIDAAERCIVRFGVQKSTLSDVVAECGTSRQTAYRIFPGGRDEVLEAVFSRAAEAYADRLSEFLESFEDPLDLVVESILFSFRELREDPVLSRALEAGALESLPGDFPSETTSLAPSRIAFAAYRARIPGLTSKQLDEIAELAARLMLSALLQGGEDTLSRGGPMPRKKLRNWLGPLVREQQSYASRNR